MLLSQAVKLRLRERESLAQSHMGDCGESWSLTCLLWDPTPLTQTLKHQREMRSPVLLYRMNAFLKNGVSVREGPLVPAGNINWSGGPMRGTGCGQGWARTGPAVVSGTQLWEVAATPRHLGWNGWQWYHNSFIHAFILSFDIFGALAMLQATAHTQEVPVSWVSLED